MNFCPYCHNLLNIELNEEAEQHFKCQACPYICHVTQKYVNRNKMKVKQVDDVLGGSDAWKNVDSTDATCPKCENTRAYYMQIQIRSADEPSSLFFRCCNPTCCHQWREG
jgi:DNA-directed RNA polymerase III subunit RPC11